MEDILKLSEQNLAKAREIIKILEIEQAWRSIGATPNLIGSVRTGLLMTHLDIDFHIYTDKLSVTESFAAVAKIADHPGVESVYFNDLAETEEVCYEWHLYYRDDEKRLWQLDMIHILRGSAFDGFAEDVVERIEKSLTPEIKRLILELKYRTPETEKIAGINYYVAVYRDGVKNWEDFRKWLDTHTIDGIIRWE